MRTVKQSCWGQHDKNEKKPEATARIDVLDGWRTASIFLVILQHLFYHSNIHSDSLLAGLVDKYGGLGVDIFFVISGFVICRGFCREARDFRRVSLLAFYIRRAFRILPPLLCYVATISVLLWGGFVTVADGTITRGLTFTCNFPGAHCGGYLGGHLWSLSVEEQFYIVFPIIFVALGSYRRVTITSLACMLPFFIITLFAFKFRESAAFLSNFVTIGVGVACALNEQFVLRMVQRMPSWLSYVVMALLLVLVRFQGSRAATVLNEVFEAPFIAYLLFTSMTAMTIIHKTLSVSLIRTIGRASYSIYLWQQLATYHFPQYWAQDGIFYAISLTLCLGFSLASFKYLECQLIEIAVKVSTAIKLRDMVVACPL